MIPVLSITAPVFLIVFLGYGCAKFKLFTSDAQKTFGLYVFYCAMPCYLFLKMAESKVSMITNIPYIASFALGTLATATISGAIANRVFKCQKSECILAIMGGVLYKFSFYRNSDYRDGFW